MGKKALTYIEIGCNILFWFIPAWLSIRFNLVSLGQQLSNAPGYMPFIANVLFNMLYVYSNLFFLFPAFNTKKISKLQYLLILISLAIIAGFLKCEINSLFSLYYSTRIFSIISFREMLITETIIAAFFLSQSLLYGIIRQGIKDKAAESSLMQEKLSLELKYLRSQINPHFLFNTLNNLYSLALKNNDDETAAGITKLSNIMRFMLNDVNENMISLDKEINYLKSYLDLQKLRYSEGDDIDINLDIQGDTGTVRIHPLMFIVFVENAFKYGINYMAHSFIHIKFAVQADTLNFAIRNSVHKQDKLSDSGLGLKNIKERLELLYPDRYNLDIRSEKNIFNVELAIKLS